MQNPFQYINSNTLNPSTAFGMLMQERSYSSPAYRYGFNGKEKDNEINVDGGDYDFGARIYDSRLGRFLTIDPASKKWPNLSSYLFANNSPLSGVDFNGLEYFYAADGTFIGKIGTSTQVRVVAQDKVLAVQVCIFAATCMPGSSQEQIKHATGLAMNLSQDVGLSNEELNTRAMLYTIRNTESWGNKTLDYDDQYGGGKFGEGQTDEEKYKDHPRKAVTKWGKTSTASGGYMFLTKSWDWVKDKINAKDFSPKNQDKAAVWLMNYRGALDLVKKGNIQEAFVKLKEEWTSLPGANEEGMKLNKALETFREGISKELNGKSEIKTPKGELLTGY